MTPSSSRGARSIRAHLILLTLVVAVPLAALLVRSRVAAYQAELDAGAVDAQRLAEATAVATAQLLADARGVLEGGATREAELLGGDPEACRTALVHTRAATPYVPNILVADPTGRLLCSIREAPDGVERQVQDRDWFRAVTAGAPFAVGAPVVGSITGDWVVGLAVPVTGPDGGLRGVLAASLPLVRFQELLAGVRIGPDELVTVADGDRTVLARSHDAAEYVGSTLPTDTVPGDRVGPGRYLVSGGTDLAGVERSWANLTIPEVGWRVFAGVPMERVRGPAAAALRQDLALGLLTLLLALGLAWSVQRRIAQPLRALVGWARSAEVQEGPAPPPPGGPTEVRALAVQLDETFQARGHAERAERAAKERYRAVLDQAVFGIGSLDASGRFLQVNPALAAMLGYQEPAPLVGRPVAGLFVDPGAWERVRDRMDAEGTVRDQEARWWREDGDVVTVRVAARRVEGGERDVSYQMIVEDITGQKEMELALRHSQKMEAVGRLAGGVAHDFNNLLTVVSGNAELLLEDTRPGDPDYDELAEIQMATARAASLTRQLLAFSRKGPESRGPVEVDDLVERLEVLIRRLLGADVELRMRLGAPDAAVWADPSPLEQTLLNMCVNARDAMPGGGVLRVETDRVWTPDDPTVPHHPEGWVRVRVEDTGTGMSADVRERIFEPFFTTKPSGEGTGLGLATSYAAIDSLGGFITVSSEAGRGTAFHVWLPAHPEEATDAGAGETEAREPLGTETVLVAEDEAGVRRFVRRVLEDAGYTVLLAADGHEAAALFRRHAGEVDLLLSDLMMPGQSGTELADDVRAVRPDLPVLFMSGYAGELDVEDASGGGGILGKPFTMAELLARVRAALEAGARHR